MKRIIIVPASVCAALLLAPAIANAAPVRTCAEGELPPFRAAGLFEVAAHRRFDLPVVTYPFAPTPRHTRPLRLDLLIDETGHVACYRLPENARGETPPLSNDEQPVIDALSTWTYTPFIRYGAPTKTYILEYIYEQEAFEKIVPLPEGPVSGFSVTLGRNSRSVSYPGYSVTVKGDSQAVFHGFYQSDVVGDHAYRLPPETVTALIDAARKTNIWSARNGYFANIIDAGSSGVNIAMGGQTKSVNDHAGDAVGMPQAVRDFMADVDRLTGTDDFIHLSATGVARLREGGFDFTSQAGADLLAAANADENASDAAVMALITAGAPVHGGKAWLSIGLYGDGDTGLLPVAVLFNRTPVIAALIDKGLLLRDGKPDPVIVNAAFQAAVAAGHMDVVQTLWAWHPALTYDEMGKPRPVTLRLPRTYQPHGPDGFAIARFLLDQGCDINAADSDGVTLMDIAAASGDPAFVRYLLDHGATIDAVDGMGDTVLYYADEDAVAILLLDAGADPLRTANNGDSFATTARRDERTPVLAWLKAHGVEGF